MLENAAVFDFELTAVRTLLATPPSHWRPFPHAALTHFPSAAPRTLASDQHAVEPLSTQRFWALACAGRVGFAGRPDGAREHRGVPGPLPQVRREGHAAGGDHGGRQGRDHLGLEP